MSLALVAVTSVVLIVVVHFAQKIARFYLWARHVKHELRELPGPPGLPLIGAVHLFKWNSIEFSKQIEGWAREYVLVEENIMGKNAGLLKIDVGPIPLVFCCGHESIKPVLESTTLISKPWQYDIISGWLGTGLLTSTNEKWFQRRKMLTPTFHFAILAGYVEVFAQQSRTFVTALQKKADTGKQFDLFPFIKRCALDIICETAMGTKIGAQVGQNNEYVNAVARINALIWDYQRFPWLWLKPIWYLTGVGFEFNRLVKLTNDFTRKVIVDRKREFETATKEPKKEVEEQKRRLAFLDLLIQMQKQNELSDEDIREEVDTFMFEGHDTTSSAMGFAISFIGLDPKVQEKVHAEVDEIFGDSDRLPNNEDLKRLNYLEQCVKEALRIMPSVPLIARRLSHDCPAGAVTLPEGLTVVIAPMATSRDPRVYENADVFDPDNFLSEKIAQRDAYSYVPFSAGPRNCIGQKFALYEEKVVLSSFFRWFRVETMKNFDDNYPVPEIILKPSEGFPVRIYSRRH